MSAPFSELSLAGKLIPGAVFLASLVGSLHCAGMCGPIVLAAAPDRRATVLYHLGRLAGYAGLGALFGWLGERLLGFSAFRFLPLASSAAIAGMLIYFGIRQLELRAVHWRLPTTVTKLHSAALTRAARGGAPSGAFAVGALSVLLPCGWLYSFLLSAAATQSTGLGALLLLSFWAGTLPALVLGPLAFRKLIRPVQRLAPRLSGALLIVAGVLTLGWRAYPALHHVARPPTAGAAVEIECPMHQH